MQDETKFLCELLHAKTKKTKKNDVKERLLINALVLCMPFKQFDQSFIQSELLVQNLGKLSLINPHHGYVS